MRYLLGPHGIELVRVHEAQPPRSLFELLERRGNSGDFLSLYHVIVNHLAEDDAIEVARSDY